MNKEKKLKWHENGYIISDLIIISIIITIICSQSFAVVGESSLALFGSVLNYNSIYLLVIIYFVFLKVKFGKKYFNYLNLFLIVVYFLASVTSFLTLLQSFGLKTLLSFVLNIVLVVYLFHTMFRDTRVWKEFKLGNSPFNEISNDMYLYILVIVVVFLLVVNLISTVYLSGVVLSVMDAIYAVLFGRYIYLYREYLDYNKKDINNKGNFDEVRNVIENTSEIVSEAASNVTDKIDEVIDDISSNLNNISDEVVEEKDNKSVKKKKKGDK